jgi:hypothetical protein
MQEPEIDPDITDEIRRLDPSIHAVATKEYDYQIGLLTCYDTIMWYPYWQASRVVEKYLTALRKVDQ